MAFFFGKSGADAIFKAFQRICRVLNSYRTKLLAAVDAAETGAIITSDEATNARVFIASATALCAVFEKIASNSGFVG